MPAAVKDRFEHGGELRVAVTQQKSESVGALVEVDLVAPDEAVQLLDTADDLLTAGVGTDMLDAEHLSPPGQYGRHRGRPG
jgi:hypothetical protein